MSLPQGYLGSQGTLWRRNNEYHAGRMEDFEVTSNTFCDTFTRYKNQ